MDAQAPTQTIRARLAVVKQTLKSKRSFGKLTSATVMVSLLVLLSLVLAVGVTFCCWLRWKKKHTNSSAGQGSTACTSSTYRGLHQTGRHNVTICSSTRGKSLTQNHQVHRESHQMWRVPSFQVLLMLVPCVMFLVTYHKTRPSNQYANRGRRQTNRASVKLLSWCTKSMLMLGNKQSNVAVAS